MKSLRLTAGLFFLTAAGSACSSLPERPGSTAQGSGAYGGSRNQACLIEAQRAWTAGQPDGVEQALARWQGPMEDPRPLCLLGQVAFTRQQFVLSAELFTQGLSFAPNSIDLLLRTAQVQEVAGRWEDASANYERVLQLQGNHAEAASGLLRASIALSDQEGGLRSARELAPQFVNNAEFLGLASDLAFFQGDFEQCIAWSQAAQELQTIHHGGEERLLLSLAWTGRHEEALAAASKSKDQDWTPEVFRTLGRSGLLAGQGAAATRYFQRYLTTHAESAEAWLDLARAQFLSGTEEKALASAGQALDRNPSSAAAQVLRAHCLFRLGQDDQAAQAYAASLALGADPAAVQPFLDLLVMRPGNLLQPEAASSAKEMNLSPQD